MSQKCSSYKTQFPRREAQIARDITVAYKYLISDDLCRRVLANVADENYMAVSRASDTLYRAKILHSLILSKRS